MNIPERIKSARAALTLKQEEVVSISGIPLSTYRKYEGGTSEPGAQAIAGLVRAGINANWLLTGEGPMLLKDLTPPVPSAPPINVPALKAIFSGVMHVHGGRASPEQIADMVVEFYNRAISEQLITSTGVGEGGSKAA